MEGPFWRMLIAGMDSLKVLYCSVSSLRIVSLAVYESLVPCTGSQYLSCAKIVATTFHYIFQ